MLLRLECVHNHPLGAFVKMQTDSAGLGWGLRRCISTKFASHAAAAGPKPTF